MSEDKEADAVFNKKILDLEGIKIALNSMEDNPMADKLFEQVSAAIKAR